MSEISHFLNVVFGGGGRSKSEWWPNFLANSGGLPPNQALSPSRALGSQPTVGIWPPYSGDALR